MLFQNKVYSLIGCLLFSHFYWFKTSRALNVSSGPTLAYLVEKQTIDVGVLSVSASAELSVGR